LQTLAVETFDHALFPALGKPAQMPYVLLPRRGPPRTAETAPRAGGL
jgi:hypothetical protein